MAAKFFTGLPLDGPDPECVRGFGEEALAGQALAGADRALLPRPGVDHSHRGPVHGQAPQPVPVTIGPAQCPRHRTGPGTSTRWPASRRVAHADMTGGFARLTGPVTLAGRAAQSRVMFGPREINLGQAWAGAARSRPGTWPTTSAARRGGAGLIVTETALPVDMVKPVDISNAILWLVSDDGRYVTGITVPVNAGFTNKK